jgi:putative ABC transport system ATP-binding protein
MTVAVRPEVLLAAGLDMRFQGPEGEISLFSALDLSILPGDTVAILGASGCGKSTLLGLLAGLELPSAGRIYLDGVELTALDEDGRARLRAQKLGFVFQAFHLLHGLTALENVMLPLELAGATEARARAAAALEQVGLAARRRHYPQQLSGGEQQRVALARAFVTQPKLLLADEPTGNLDRATGERAAELLFRLNAEHGTTLVMVTHDQDLARHCSRVLQLVDGRLEAA